MHLFLNKNKISFIKNWTLDKPDVRLQASKDLRLIPPGLKYKLRHKADNPNCDDPFSKLNVASDTIYVEANGDTLKYVMSGQQSRTVTENIEIRELGHTINTPLNLDELQICGYF